MEVIHTALWCSSIDETTAFYTEGVGLDHHWDFTADDGVENHYFGADSGAEIQFKYDPDGADVPTPAGYDHIALGVDDTDAAFDRITRATGCPVLREPETLDLPVGDVRIAFLEDPDGYAVELVQPLE